MPLEDHIGDICRKARLQTKTDLAQCAELAGLAVEELQAWETEGLIDREVNVVALAELVGLDAGKAVKWLMAGGRPRLIYPDGRICG